MKKQCTVHCYSPYSYSIQPQTLHRLHWISPKMKRHQIECSGIDMRLLKYRPSDLVSFISMPITCIDSFSPQNVMNKAFLRVFIAFQYFKQCVLYLTCTLFFPAVVHNFSISMFMWKNTFQVDKIEKIVLPIRPDGHTKC